MKSPPIPSRYANTQAQGQRTTSTYGNAHQRGQLRYPNQRLRTCTQPEAINRVKTDRTRNCRPFRFAVPLDCHDLETYTASAAIEEENVNASRATIVVVPKTLYIASVVLEFASVSRASARVQNRTKASQNLLRMTILAPEPQIRHFAYHPPGGVGGKKTVTAAQGPVSTQYGMPGFGKLPVVVNPTTSKTKVEAVTV